MTPCELETALEAYRIKENTKQEQRRQEIYASALLISRFVLSKNIPPYERVFGAGEREEMTDEQMLRMAEALNAMFGGTDSREAE